MSHADATQWYVYVVRCSDGSFYTGIATDVERRIDEHNSGSNGAKYTRGRRPVTLLHKEACADRSAALKREIAIKKMTRREKVALIADHSSDS